MSEHYILRGHEVVETDLMTWARWLEDRSNSRRVADETIGDIRVSTVFLGLDHSFGEGPPQIFETLVFGGELDGYMDRCATWAEAEVMHKEMVNKAKGWKP